MRMIVRRTREGRNTVHWGLPVWNVPRCRHFRSAAVGIRFWNMAASMSKDFNGTMAALSKLLDAYRTRRRQAVSHARLHTARSRSCAMPLHMLGGNAPGSLTLLAAVTSRSSAASVETARVTVSSIPRAGNRRGDGVPLSCYPQPHLGSPGARLGAGCLCGLHSPNSVQRTRLCPALHAKAVLTLAAPVTSDDDDGDSPGSGKPPDFLASEPLAPVIFAGREAWFLKARPAGQVVQHPPCAVPQTGPPAHATA